MKSRHMEGLDHPLTLDEILDETNQLDVTSKTKQWLLTEALGTSTGLRYLSFISVWMGTGLDNRCGYSDLRVRNSFQLNPHN